MKHALIIAASAIFAFATGCSAFERTTLDTIDDTYDPTTVTGQLDFYHALPGRSAVTNDEAFRGVLLFVDGVDTAQNYDERVQAMKNRGWLRDWYDEPANMLVQRGRLASVLSKAIGVDGGVMYNLTMAAPRYANREMMHLGIMQPGTEQQVVSGLDLLSILGRTEDYLVAQALSDLADSPVQELPEQPDQAPQDAPDQPEAS